MQNRIPEAERDVRTLLAGEPANLTARTLLGVILFRLGRLPEAEQTLEAVHTAAPDQVDSIGLLAVIRRAQGNFPGAIEMFQLLVQLGHAGADIFNNLGCCWLEMGDAVAAGGAFKRAIEIDRNSAHGYFNLGLALKLSGRSYETFATFKRAIELNPDAHEAYVELWQQMRQLLNWKEGLPILEAGLCRHPDSEQMTVMVASSYGKVGLAEKAEKLFRSAASKFPAAGPPYAHWLQEEGRFDESIPILQKAIRHEPVQGQAYYNLAVAKCFEVDGKPLIQLASKLVGTEAVGKEGKMFLHYALAKSYDQERDYEMAMRNYDQANALASQLYNPEIKPDPKAEASEHATLVELYTKQRIDDLSAFGSDSSVPLFIVGMIRTGTTLLDQILSSHPSVKSAGEQPFWQVSSGRVNRRWLTSGGNATDIKELEMDYLAALRDAAGSSERVTDKMPTNFAHIGLMSIVFPRAKFIHIRRNPLDTCVSIYTTFLGSGTQFAYSQENIVAYYMAYLRMMEHWVSVIPRGQMIEIDYEELVTNKEGVLREVLEFCGLEWDDACLRHEQNSAQVSTPSLWSARQPVNVASVERWRRYEPWLGKLLELKNVTHPEPLHVR
jgi:tetratricopeptide (TPR) repeat protein